MDVNSSSSESAKSPTETSAEILRDGDDDVRFCGVCCVEWDALKRSFTVCGECLFRACHDCCARQATIDGKLKCMATECDALRSDGFALELFGAQFYRQHLFDTTLRAHLRRELALVDSMRSNATTATPNAVMVCPVAFCDGKLVVTAIDARCEYCESSLAPRMEHFGRRRAVYVCVADVCPMRLVVIKRLESFVGVCDKCCRVVCLTCFHGRGESTKHLCFVDWKCGEENAAGVGGIVKKCPSCSTHIVKAHGGCDDMKCSVCGARFYWTSLVMKTKDEPFFHTPDHAQRLRELNMVVRPINDIRSIVPETHRFSSLLFFGTPFVSCLLIVCDELIRKCYSRFVLHVDYEMNAESRQRLVDDKMSVAEFERRLTASFSVCKINKLAYDIVWQFAANCSAALRELLFKCRVLVADGIETSDSAVVASCSDLQRAVNRFVDTTFRRYVDQFNFAFDEIRRIFDDDDDDVKKLCETFPCIRSDHYANYHLFDGTTNGELSSNVCRLRLTKCVAYIDSVFWEKSE